MFDISGKVAFVTGGSSGIGLGIVKALLNSGAQVAIGYQTPGHLEDAKAWLGWDEERLHGIFVEVSDRASVEAAARAVIDRFGAVHILVSNAGIFCDKDVAHTTHDEFSSLIDVNVHGLFNCVKAFLPLLRANGEARGHIVATSSILGLLACQSYGAYSASKFAVVGLMESLRGELLDQGIGVSVYCPGSIHTNIHSRKNKTVLSGPARVQWEAGNQVPPNPNMVCISDDIRYAGEAVVDGIKHDKLYILSHPHFNETIAEKFSYLLRAAPDYPPFEIMPQDSLLGRCLNYDSL